MVKSTYNPFLFYRSSPLEIVTMQTNDTLILANNHFVNKKEDAVRDAKIKTKN